MIWAQPGSPRRPIHDRRSMLSPRLHLDPHEAQHGPRRGHGVSGGQADGDGDENKAHTDRGHSNRRGHGDPGDKADPDGDKDQTYTDREEWHMYRADEDVLPGSAPLKSFSFFQKLARAAAASARHARQMKLNMSKLFNAGEKVRTDISRDDFIEFKDLLELSLKEIKSSIQVSSTEHVLVIEKCIGAHSKDMELLLQKFEAMSGQVKEAVSMGARAEKTSSENAEKIIELLTEIAVTLRKVPPSNAGSFVDRFTRMWKYSSEASQLYEQLRQYLIFLGGYLILLGVLDPKDEQLKKRFFDKFLPDDAPGVYEDICREGRDLVSKDFASDLSFQMSMHCADGLLVTSTAKKSPMVDNVHGCHLRLRQPQLSLDIKYDTTKHVSALVVLPGLAGSDMNPALKICYPFRDSSFNVDAFYRQAGLRANISMHPVRGDALVSLSGLFGSRRLNFGGLMKMDFGNGVPNSYSLGCSFNTDAFSLGIQCNSHAQVLMMMSHRLEPRSLISDAVRRTNLGGDLYDLLSRTPVSQTTVGAQAIRCLATGSSVVMVGCEYADPSNCVKLRVGSSGILSAVLKRKVFWSVWVGLKSHFNLWRIRDAPRLGLSISIGEASSSSSS